MTAQPLSSADPLFVAYLLAFGAAALACFLVARSAHRIDDADTRRGLSVLLVLSGGWAVAHVAFLLAPSEDLGEAFYTVGLIVGLTTTLPWLYFCSAYTGRTLHRNRTYRRVLGGTFLLIILLKVTNPVHKLYFTAEPVSTPFAHLAVEPGLIHWLVLGLSYTLAAIGYFMLFELFSQVGHDTKPLAVLAGLAGFPVLLDIAAILSPRLVEINYEPLGVAAFGVGVVFLYLGDFRTVQLAGEHEAPVIVLDDDERVRDYNSTARELFPDLVGSIGEPITDGLPKIAGHLDEDESIIEIKRLGGMRYYGVTKSPFTADQSHTGTLVSFTDVTDREQYRRELERQNERLENFASMVSHDLRNPLTVAKGNLDLARKDVDRDELEAADAALDRMETLIDDLLTLARQGQPIEDPEPIDIGGIARECWGVVDTSEAELVLADDVTIQADASRLQQLLENLFRNSIEHGGDDVTITVGLLDDESGLYVADDGPGIPEEARDQIFESGYSTNQDGTGFGLAIVREIAEAHGWEIRATESESGGARFEITGVRVVD